MLNNIKQFEADKADHLTSVKNAITSNISGRITHDMVLLYILGNILKPKTYLEIGVHHGTSMSYLISSYGPIHCIGIDLFENTLAQYHKDNLSLENTNNNLQKNNSYESKIDLWKGNSTDKELISKIDNSSIDLLLIDGDHSYKGVKTDWNNYVTKVRTGGVIVLDDCKVGYSGIIKFGEEIKKDTNFKVEGTYHEGQLIITKV